MRWRAILDRGAVPPAAHHGFIDPWSDPLGKGYQLSHSLIAFGRGEWFGVGLGASVEKLLFLPEAHTDFLLAVIAEELGFAGVALVIALFMWLLFRAYAIGRQAARLERPFAALVAQGIGVWIGVQAFINIGVNMGVLPTKGLTLPLLSFGGSGIVANCVALAILLRIDYENRRLLRGFTYERRRAVLAIPRGQERSCKVGVMTDVMITTGGTGGHVFPGLAVAAKLAARGAQRVLAGHARRHGGEAGAAARRRVRGRVVSRRARQGLAHAAARPVRAARPRASTARAIIRRRKPDVVLGFGGFASFPGGLMGTAAGKPLVLHDANAVAGLANRVLAHGADRILLGFPQALRGRAREARRMGRQSAARRDLRAAAAGGALRRPQRAAAPAGRRRQPRRAGAERARARGARAAAAPRSGRRSCTRRARSTSPRCAQPMRGTASTPNASRSSTTWRRATRGPTS